MKNKPLRHKESNIFKFQSFSERIANVNVDIFHRIGHENETDSEDLACYFNQTLQKWNLLNLTEDYNLLRKQVSGVITLPQLLLEKENVVDILLKHLKLSNPLSLQPFLELVIALAKDLRKEFYPFFPRFLSQLVNLLNIKNAEILEWTFHCLAYIFKFLWRYMVKDVRTVFTSLVPLLDRSKPEYVNNFAAESFSFVARKVKEKRAFLILIVQCLEENPKAIPGCGRLLFEIINGVDGRFHSCAEATLILYFELIHDEELPQSKRYLYFNLLQQVISNISQKIKPTNSCIFWTTINNKIDQLYSKYDSDNIYNNTSLEWILKLILKSLEYKKGRFLINSEELIHKLIEIDSTKVNLQILEVLSNITSTILTSSIQLSQENASRIVQKIMAIKNLEVRFKFVESVVDYSSFDELILPRLFPVVYKNEDNVSLLRLITNIILNKAPLCKDGSILKNSSGGSNFVISDVNFYNCLERCLQKCYDNEEDRICAIVCSFYATKTNRKETIKKLILDSLVELKNTDRVSLVLFKVLICMEKFVQLNRDCESVDEYLELDFDSIVPFCKSLNNLCGLRVLDIYLTFCSEDFRSKKLLDMLWNELKENLSSPFHEVRFLTTHIFSLFEHLPEFNQDEPWRVFSTCHKIESIQPSVQSIRDQLHLLNLLNYNSNYNTSEYREFPLRYLLGVLFINFQLIWEPVIKIIASYAIGMDTDIFWNVFYRNLGKSVEFLKNSESVSSDSEILEVGCLNVLYKDVCVSQDRPDYNNYRILMWKTLAEFPDVAEVKNKDVISLFLTYIEEGCFKSNTENSGLWNIKKNKTNSEVSEMQEEPIEEKSIDLNIDIENKENNEEDDEEILEETNKDFPKSNIKTLVAHLTLFTKFINPKSVYRETDLNRIYMDLLMHKNHGVQKLALDCLMTYKHKYLIPYKDRLYNLIDEKNFKKELTLFHINTDSEMIQNEHRHGLIPVIMKIVYGKMTIKAGLRTGGKTTGQLRRQLVLQFVSNCNENELISFLQMSFKLFQNHITPDTSQMVSNIEKNLNLEQIIHPKRLQSALNLLEIVFEKFGAANSEKMLSYLVNILICIGTIVGTALNTPQEIHAGYLSMLRQARNSCIQILTKFFNHFESYRWKASEINVIFDMFVWPRINSLSYDSIQTPTPLLKLLMQWTSNPRYFILLVKKPETEENSILNNVMKLLTNPKSSPGVVNAIMDMLLRLLTLEMSQDELKLPRIPAGEMIPIDQSILEVLSLKETLNFGSKILLPHVPIILQKLQYKIQGKKNVGGRDLTVLSRISELTWEPESCDRMLNLLLPILVKKACAGTDEETIINFVNTICNLTQKVPEAEKYLKSVAPLFGSISTVRARKILIGYIKTVAEKCQTERKQALERHYDLIFKLNAYDKRWIEQPDFNQRLDCFKEINGLISNADIDCDLGIFIIHCCVFTLKNEADISLKDSASDCLKSICPMLALKYKTDSAARDSIVNDTILQLIKTGLRTDKLRNEMVSLLGHMSRASPDVHFVFRDLEKYTNKVDLEVDFFENIQHLQTHRHVRALLKFCQIAKELEKPPNPRTLTQYIFPLASAYLCNDRHVGKNSLVDAAIEAVSVMCRLLPWHQYETVLKYYLAKLRKHSEFQKQLVRIIVVIVDAFHFDLSKVNSLPLPVPVREQDIEEKQEEELDEILNDDEVKEDVEDIKNTEDVKAIDRVIVLGSAAAKRLIFNIVNGLLPQLYRTISQLTQHDVSHKVNRKRIGIEKEEEDTLRVPIALALVKLLHKLPPGLLERNLRGILMKLCTFFKSHLDSVRRTARETLQKIMVTLGPKYLEVLLGEMVPLLTRGFQSHVLVYTVHSVLSCLKDQYKPGDLDKCLQTILQLCQADIFGIIADEKEVAHIVNKVSEAKSVKSYDTFQILAEFITEKCFTDLILPIKEVLSTARSAKKVHKAQECLRYIVLGLVDNKFVSVESLIVFAYGTASQSIPEFKEMDSKPALTKEEKNKPKSDCFIIPEEPRNKFGIVRSKVVTSSAANAHILVGFGLRLCYFILKREMIKKIEYKPFLDPMVAVLYECLNSRHVKLCTLSLHCLFWMFKIELPSLKNMIKKFSSCIFEILHKYAAAGLSKGDNFELVVAAFKATSVLVRDIKYHSIETDQLKALLLYVEQDLCDYDRQTTAFGLLKAIITRGLNITEVHEVMMNVAKLSITSEMPHIRLQARQVFHQYLMDYPLGKRLDGYIAFLVSQLNYEMPQGRESALAMVLTIVNTFPLEKLKSYSGLFFVTLGARLENEDMPEVKKTVANCIKAMLKKVDNNERNKLFEIIILWFEDTKIEHRRVAAQLCGHFVSVEKDKFEKRLDTLTPVLTSQFFTCGPKTPGQFVRLTLNEEIEVSEEETRSRDHHLFQVLLLLHKISAQCPTFLARIEDIESISVYVQTLLAYPHEWVRLAAAQFLGYVLATIDPDKVGELMVSNRKESVGYILSDPKPILKSLTLDLCAQLQAGGVKESMAEQVVKNLMFVVRVLKHVPLDVEVVEDGRVGVDGTEENVVNLRWLVRRVRKIVNAEVAQTPNEVVLRTAIFQWIGGIAIFLDKNIIISLVNHLLGPLVREMSNTDEKLGGANLKHLAKVAANQIKNKIGNDLYTKTVSKLQTHLMIVRAKRKRERAQLAVTEPEVAARKKIRVQEKKKELKRKKKSKLHGKEYVKKKKVERV